MLFNLISIFEKFNLDKFTIYSSKNISIKQYIEPSDIKLGNYE